MNSMYTMPLFFPVCLNQWIKWITHFIERDLCEFIDVNSKYGEYWCKCRYEEVLRRDYKKMCQYTFIA